jgi:hypothetical protein
VDVVNARRERRRGRRMRWDDIVQLMLSVKRSRSLELFAGVCE